MDQSEDSRMGTFSAFFGLVAPLGNRRSVPMTPKAYATYPIDTTRPPASRQCLPNWLGNAASRLKQSSSGQLPSAKVGTGWSRTVSSQIRKQLDTVVSPKSKLSKPLKKPKATWVEPIFTAMSNIAISHLKDCSGLVRSSVLAMCILPLRRAKSASRPSLGAMGRKRTIFPSFRPCSGFCQRLRFSECRRHLGVNARHRIAWLRLGKQN
jgi:hypothetical protein